MLALLPFGLVIVGVWWHAQPAPEDSWQVAEGTVAQIDHFEGARGIAKYRLKVRYTVDGREYVKVGPRHSSPVPFRVGEETLVRYDPANPSRSYLPESDEAPTRNRATVLTAISGLFALWFGWSWWADRRTKRKHKQISESRRTADG